MKNIHQTFGKGVIMMAVTTIGLSDAHSAVIYREVFGKTTAGNTVLSSTNFGWDAYRGTSGTPETSGTDAGVRNRGQQL